MQTSQSLSSTCSIALKEWHATIGALAQGRQIVLLRKGGIHDAGGVFELEHQRFWLWPTWLHQNANLLQPAHRDLLLSAPRDTQTISLQWWAQVEDVWALHEADQRGLEGARHIWSDDYLDLRFGYKPQHPLLCVALRVFEVPQPHRVGAQSKYFGCRSWIELDDDLPLQPASPALDDAAFAAMRQELKARLAPTAFDAVR